MRNIFDGVSVFRIKYLICSVLVDGLVNLSFKIDFKLNSFFFPTPEHCILIQNLLQFDMNMIH